MTIPMPEGNPAAIREAAATIRGFPSRFNPVAAQVFGHVSTLLADSKGPYFDRLSKTMATQDHQIMDISIRLRTLAKHLDEYADSLQIEIDRVHRLNEEQAREAARKRALDAQRKN